MNYNNKQVFSDLQPTVATCILAVIPMIILGGISEYGLADLSEELAAGIGVGILLVMIAVAGVLFAALMGILKGMTARKQREE